jgi:hypothetical protein
LIFHHFRPLLRESPGASDARQPSDLPMMFLRVLE